MTDQEMKKLRYKIVKLTKGTLGPPGFWVGDEWSGKALIAEIEEYNRAYNEVSYNTRCLADWHTGEAHWYDTVVDDDAGWAVVLDLDPPTNEWGVECP